MKEYTAIVIKNAIDLPVLDKLLLFRALVIDLTGVNPTSLPLCSDYLEKLKEELHSQLIPSDITTVGKLFGMELDSLDRSIRLLSRYEQEQNRNRND